MARARPKGGEISRRLTFPQAPCFSPNGQISPAIARLPMLASPAAPASYDSNYRARFWRFDMVLATFRIELWVTKRLHILSGLGWYLVCSDSLDSYSPEVQSVRVRVWRGAATI